MHAYRRYSPPAVALHWIMFVIVAAGWALGSYTSELPFSPQKLRYISYHKWLGVTVFLLAAARCLWRFRRGVPPLPPMPRWQSRLAGIVHTALYGLLFVIPLTGWLFSSATGVPTVYFGIVQIPDLLQKDKAIADVLRVVHAALNWTLLAGVIGHAAFALKHHFVDRDDVLARMLPFINPRA